MYSDNVSAIPYVYAPVILCATSYIRISPQLTKQGSITHQMALPITLISCCISQQLNIFCNDKNALAFNWDRCCHLAICLQLILLDQLKLLKPTKLKGHSHYNVLGNLNFPIRLVQRKLKRESLNCMFSLFLSLVTGQLHYRKGVHLNWAKCS